MRIITNMQEMAQICRVSSRPLGLVPTMGALHEGHLALIKHAQRKTRTLAVSIFINPAQFGPNEDLVRYPKSLDLDLELLSEAGVDLVFMPTANEIYPPGFDSWIDVGNMATKLEGAHRPGHFRGVATIITKLFNLIVPDFAYFGQKDGQQSAIIRKLVRDLFIGLEVVIRPTVREQDGLAFSSRNLYLTAEQRKAASVIYLALGKAKAIWRRGEQNCEHLREAVRGTLKNEPLIEQIDYISVADTDTLEELSTASFRAMVSVALYMGQTRLIDNLILE
jgi:pantoate--beta-alanine ligase